MDRAPIMPTLTDITIDFESYYDKDCSLSKLSTAQYVSHHMFKVHGVGIKEGDDDTEYYDEDECVWALNQIDWETANLVGHNCLFDGYVLKEVFNHVPKRYSDTAAMARALAPGQSASLKDTSIRYFPDDATMRKGEELADSKGLYDLPLDIAESLAGYCIQDVDLCYALYNLMLPDIPASELDLIHLTTDMFVNPTLRLNEKLVREQYENEIAYKEQLFERVGVPTTTLRSNLKFTAHVESLGIVPPVKRSITTGKMIPAFAKKDAGWLQLQKKYPQHKDLWEARQLAKSTLEETRALRFIESVNKDGTFSVPLKYYAAHTGRFGGSDKLNLQNLPRDSQLRRALIAPDNYLVYVADLSAIEARMLAWLAGESELLEQFRYGEDVYSNFASDIYGKKVTKDTEPVLRFVGKTAILGLGYGMGTDKFQITMETGAAGPAIPTTNAQAKNVVDLYRNKFWKIPALWKKMENLAIASMQKENWGQQYGPLTVGNRRLILPNGLAMHYKDLDFGQDGLEFTKGKVKQKTYGGSITENIVQALSRIVITDGLLKADKQLRAIDSTSKVAFQVHDELICIAPKDNPEEIMKLLIDSMCHAPDWAPNLPLAAEGGFDSSYSK